MGDTEKWNKLLFYEQVNGESQKKAEEITAEVAIALTLSQLHPEAGNLRISGLKSSADGYSSYWVLLWVNLLRGVGKVVQRTISTGAFSRGNMQPIVYSMLAVPEHDY